jgi:hypothetical protein
VPLADQYKEAAWAEEIASRELPARARKERNVDFDFMGIGGYGRS